MPRTRKTIAKKGQIVAVPNGTEFTKATFYLSQENVIALEKIRVKYLERKQNIDKSALMRRAVELLAKEEGV